MLKFNMGSGRNKRPGFINVDFAEASEPDEVFNLEQTPWPWPDNCAGEVLFNHSLEHMGQDPQVFLAIMKELYRICAPGATVAIHVPDPRHEHFINDPTHVRPITPAMLSLFDREQNEEWGRQGAANTPLALYLDVDFALASCIMLLAEPYRSQHESGQITAEEVAEAVGKYNNVVQEWRITLLVRKPAP